MKTFLPTLLLALALATPTAHAQKAPAFHTLDGRTLRPVDIDRTVQQLMDSARVPGLAVALLEDNKVRYLHTYGYRNLETKAPLELQTAMYGASFSKAVFAYLVMQLVQEKRLDPDKPMAQYLPRPLPGAAEPHQHPRHQQLWRLASLLSQGSLGC